MRKLLGCWLLLLVLGVPTSALAQDDGPTERDYVLPYVAVVVLAGLGIAAAAKPSRRERDE